MQPVIKDKDGIVRFKQNKIVRDLLDRASMHGLGLNEIGGPGYTQEDREQLAQLIGYSISGYHELSYVSDESAAEADAAAFALTGLHPGCRANGCEIHKGVPRYKDKG